MMRFVGIGKVLCVLLMDFSVLFALFRSPLPAILLTAAVALYAWQGGRLGLWQEHAVPGSRLPRMERHRLEEARLQLIEDVRSTSGLDISRIRLYLSPDEAVNATAYGARCICVTQGTFESCDQVTLMAVLGHEICHILHFDPEFRRAIFLSAALAMVGLGIASLAAAVFMTLLFLVVTCFFHSWLGVLAFQGTTKLTGGMFHLMQLGLVAVFRVIMGLVSRSEEYRSDRYSCRLGYGLQLSHFLAVYAPDDAQATLSRALYGSHPSTKKRIARLEQQLETMPRPSCSSVRKRG